jgi:transglutaminase-like putative cysteine protease
METFHHKFGDCKDFSLFLQECLKSRGIKSELVLLKPYSTDQFAEEPPRVPYFTHCIVQVETAAKPFFADPTTTAAASILPIGDLGSGGLLCGEQGCQVIAMPEVNPDNGQLKIEATFENLNENPVRVKTAFLNTGCVKYWMAFDYQKNASRMFEKSHGSMMREGFKDFEISDHQVFGDDDTLDPLEHFPITLSHN